LQSADTITIITKFIASTSRYKNKLALPRSKTQSLFKLM